MSNQGIPPGSGAVKLYCQLGFGGNKHHAAEEHGWSCSAHACVEIGVRFPANDPDPGRFYRNDTLYRCTVCGRVGSVGRCCGDETRERA